ncbi:MAG: hypothetical protein DWQ02_26710 [Bacteroidetes bacterium]|nr:MAG: hypothetical protein DWQ02_26710 [Bacteroidota bacterium]
MKNRLRLPRIYIVVILHFFIIGLCSAQSPAFRQYTTDDGLPSMETYDCWQDKMGYIWVATDNGLCRFNGYEFEHFGIEEGLKDLTVFKIYEDYKEDLWFTTLSGNIYQFKNEQIQPYTYNDTIQKYADKFEFLKHIHLDTSGTIYTAVNGLGLLKISANGKSKLSEQICGTFILQLDSTILVSGLPCRKEKSLRSIYFIENDTSKKITYELVPKETSSGQSFTYQVDKSTFLLWSRGNLICIKDYEIAWQMDYPETITAILREDSGSFLIGHHFKQGLSRYESLEAIKKGSKTIIIPDISISSLMRDNTGSLWISTLEDGLLFLPDENIQLFGKNYGLPTNKISALALKNEQDLFVGFKKGEVYYRNESQNKFYQLPISSKDKEIYSLKYDPHHDRLWKASIRVYLGKDPFNNFSSIPPYKKLDKPEDISIKKLFLGQGDTLWGTATATGGFYGIDRNSGNMVVASRQWNWGAQRVFSIFEDFQKRVWVGKNDGLYEFKEDTLITANLIHPALSYRIEEIGQLKDSTLVIGTRGKGLLFWKNDKTVHLTTSNGLISDIIRVLHIDALDRIWVGTPHGLSIISLQNNPNEQVKIENLTKEHGLPANEISAITSNGENAWIGTIKGLASIQKKVKNQQVVYTPKPVFDKIYVNGDALSITQLSKLPYQKNNIQIKFFALNFKLDGQIEYRYRINTDGIWTTTSERTTNYGRLNPGNYQFEVQAQNEIGQWSESTILTFKIKAPFWQRWWFILICVFLLIGIGFKFFQNRTTQLKREATLQQLRAEKMETQLQFEQEINHLEQAALRAQINPHFIFNCLNSIQSFIYDNDKVRAVHYLSQFAELIRRVLNISLNSKIDLKEEVELLTIYLDLEKMRFEEEFDYEIVVDKSIDPFTISLPPLLIQPFVENAIIHGLSVSGRTGKISIEYLIKEGYLIVSIEDNGVGLNESRNLKKSASNLHQPVGMSITRKRLKLIQPAGTGNAVKAEELKNSDGSVLGTHVEVKIKLDEENNT